MEPEGKTEKSGSLSDPYPGLALEFQYEVHECVRGINGVQIGHGLLGPDNACFSSRPNSKKGSAIRRGKLPSRDEVWHRRTEDVNKEIADDLRGRVTIEIGGHLIWSPSSEAVRHKKKRV